MGSFGQQEREQFGQNIRVAMECIEGTLEPVQGKAMPLDEASIRHRLKALSQAITSHHSLVHEGGYTIQPVEDNVQRLHEQFVQQQHAADISQFNVEKELRNDKESFDTVRTLLPENYRFRIVDAHGQDIRNGSEAGISNGGTWLTVGFDDYTRVYCGEPVPNYCHAGVMDKHVSLFTSEAPAHYATNAHG